MYTLLPTIYTITMPAIQEPQDDWVLKTNDSSGHSVPQTLMDHTLLCSGLDICMHTVWGRRHPVSVVLSAYPSSTFCILPFESIMRTPNSFYVHENSNYACTIIICLCIRKVAAVDWLSRDTTSC
jgi:hypothetical protein